MLLSISYIVMIISYIVSIPIPGIQDLELSSPDTLIGFDCSAPVYEKTYSILGHAPCQQINTTALQYREVNLTLIQMPVTRKMQARTCSITITSKKLYCSMLKSASIKMSPGNFGGATSIRLNKLQCEELWATKVYTVNGVDYKLNVEDINLFTSGDDITKDGYCGTWSKTISLEIIKVTLKTITISSHLDPKGSIVSISVPEYGQLRLGAPGFATSADDTVFVWDTLVYNNCIWELLYQGAGIEVTDTTHTRVVIVQQMTIAATIKDSMIVCGLRMEATSDPFVYHMNHVNTPHIQFQALADRRWSSAINSLSQFILTTIDKNSDDHSILLNDAFCKLEQSVNLNLLMDHTSSPAERGFKFMGERGWTIERVGEAIIVSKCKETAYMFNVSTRCYDAIPINVFGYKGRCFINPLTREIVHSANVLPCNSMILPKILIRGVWYVMNPKLIKEAAPTTLPSRLNSLKNTLLVQARGIYPHELAAEVEEPMYYHTLRSEALNSLLHLSNPTLGDSETDTWSPSGRLYKLVHSVWTWRHTTSIVVSIILIAIGITGGSIVLFWFHLRLTNLHKLINKNPESMPLLLTSTDDKTSSPLAPLPGTGNYLVHRLQQSGVIS